MKEIMIRLYSNQYFGIILFSIIGILTLLFVIVLILAIRDAKKQKKIDNVMRESDEANKMADVAFAQDNMKPVDLSLLKDDKSESPVNLSEIDNGIDKPVADPTSEENGNDQVFPDLNITAPISTENINNAVKPTKEIPTGTESEDLKNIALTLAKEYQKEQNKSANDSIETPILKPQQSEQFSSVFVNSKNNNNDSIQNNNNTEIPNIDSLPSPQPIKVIEESKIFDTSSEKQDTK